MTSRGDPESDSWEPRSTPHIVLRRVAGGLAAGLVFSLVGRFVWANWHEVKATSIEIRPWMLLASTGLLGLYFLVRATLWHHLTIRTGTAIGYGSAVAAWLYSQLGKYIPGKVFLFLGRLAPYRLRGKQTALVSMAFAVETVATLTASLLTIQLALIISGVSDFDVYRWPLLVSVLLLLVVLHPKVLDKVLHLGLRALRRTQLRWELNTRDTYSVVVLYVLNWLIFGLAFFAFINSIYSVEADLILYLAGAFSIASLIGMLSVFVPSGLGVREGILMYLLDFIMPTDYAIVVGLSARLWFTLTELLAIATVFVIRLAKGSKSKSRKSGIASKTETSGDPRHSMEPT